MPSPAPPPAESNLLALMAALLAFLVVFAFGGYLAWQVFPWAAFQSSNGEPSDLVKLILITGAFVPIVMFVLAIVAFALLVATALGTAYLAHGLVDDPPLRRRHLVLGLPALLLLAIAIAWFVVHRP
jgi:hypothetical protein